MKHFLRTWVFGLVSALLLGGTASAQQKWATIDVQKVWDGYWKTKQATDQFVKRRTEMEAEYKNMVDDYKKMKEDYDSLLKGANDQNVSPDEREKRKKAAEDKLKNLKDQEDGITQYNRTSQATLAELQDRMRANLLTEIRNVVTAKAKSAGFPLVIDVAAKSVNGTPVVMFSNNENDITDSVILQLNANAPTDSAKIDETPAPEKKDEKKKDSKK